MKTLSGVIIVKNEEKRIKNVIQTLLFCDEIIVIDDQSTDKTVDIAKKMKAKVFSRALETDFASQRNFAMEIAKGDWILFIDADEEPTKELIREIKENIQETWYDSFALRRRDFWLKKEMRFGEIHEVRNKGIIRLVKKGSGQWFGNVHEVFHTSEKSGLLEHFINHYPHPTVADFINDINFYSTLRAKELFTRGKKTSIIEIMMMPFLKFLYTYFIKFGLFDGAQGFMYSFLMSFHSFLVRSKLYQYSHTK